MDLSGRKLILGVCGGIAAYKAALLIRLLKKAGAEVQVMMTKDAARFVTPLTLGTLSESEVLTEIFPGDDTTGSWTKHIELGLWADLFIVAPATAQTIAKLTHGFCDSMLTATALAARCPLLVCPAMDHDMYLHPATARNIAQLRADGVKVMEPGHGSLASGLVGVGRLPEPEKIVEQVARLLGASGGPLAGKRVLLTAGPTRESLDPVRFISNRSTGTMGYELAAAARRLGAEVTLISGPTALDAPAGVVRVDVETAQEMYDCTHEHLDYDVAILAAAVSDFAPASRSDHKMKKTGDVPVIELRKTRDILASLGRQKKAGQTLIGFAMETENGRANAQDKLERKRLDWIVLNVLGDEGAGFGTGTNRVTVLSAGGAVHELPVLPKRDVAEEIWRLVGGRMQGEG